MAFTPGAGKLSAEVSGPGMNRFLIADAWLQCREAMHDAEQFNVAVEFLIDAAWDELNQPRFKAMWEEGYAASWFDDDGHRIQPGSMAFKMARHKQMRLIKLIVSRAGVFGRKEQEVDEADEFLQKAMARANARVADVPSRSAAEEDEDEAPA